MANMPNEVVPMTCTKENYHRIMVVSKNVSVKAYKRLLLGGGGLLYFSSLRARNCELYVLRIG